MQYLTVILRLLIQSKDIISTNTLRGGSVHKLCSDIRGRGDARNSWHGCRCSPFLAPYRPIMRLWDATICAVKTS